MNNEIWNPFIYFGFKDSFYEINLDIFLNVIYALAIIVLMAIVFRFFLFKKNIFNDCMIYLGETFYDFIKETIGYVDKKIFSFIFSLFFVLLVFNLLSLIPGLEEPTKDINVTIAFAIFSFFSIHKIAFIEQGFHYLEHWFKMPISFKCEDFFLKNKFFFIFELLIRIVLNLCIAILLFPFEILSRISLIMSLSFRLFGNIFGGSKIIELVGIFLKKSLLLKIILSCIGINLILMLFFGFFEGLMQAFIFTLVSLNNIGILLGDEFLDKKIKTLKEENDFLD